MVRARHFLVLDEVVREGLANPSISLALIRSYRRFILAA
jgi:hypothetical protein